MRASGPTTTTTMLGRKESNLQPSASEAAALPVAPLPNALLPMSGWRGSNPRVSGWKPDAFPLGDTRMWDRRELNPQPRAEEALALPVELQTRGVRIELTMLASERRGYGPLDHRWSHPVLVRALDLPSPRRSPLIFALSENDETRAGGGNRTRFSGKASRCPTNGRHPRVHGRKESNLQQRVLEARALTDGASAVDG